MSNLKANLRVVPEVSDKRPAESRVLEAAEQLSKLGFTVLRIGRFGVNVEAPAEKFLNVLGIHPFDSAGGSASVHPHDPKLRDLIDLIEMAPPPELYCTSLQENL